MFHPAARIAVRDDHMVDGHDLTGDAAHRGLTNPHAVARCGRYSHLTQPIHRLRWIEIANGQGAHVGIQRDTGKAPASRVDVGDVTEQVGLRDEVGGGIENLGQHARGLLGARALGDVFHRTDMANHLAVHTHGCGVDHKQTLANARHDHAQLGAVAGTVRDGVVPAGLPGVPVVRMQASQPHVGQRLFMRGAEQLAIRLIGVDRAANGIGTEQAHRRGVVHGLQLGTLAGHLAHQLVKRGGNRFDFHRGTGQLQRLRVTQVGARELRHGGMQAAQRAQQPQHRRPHRHANQRCQQHE